VSVEVFDLQLYDMGKWATSIDKNHESLFRSWHILSLVEKLLHEGVPPSVILGLIDHCKTLPPVTESPVFR
jgi:hypothetical protein